MSIDDDEKQLGLLRLREKQATARAKELADAFRSAAGAYAAEWVEEHVQATVKGDHEHTLSLAPARLGELKADLQAAREAVPRKAFEALRNLPWAFRTPNDTGPKSGSVFDHSYSPVRRYDHRLPSGVEEPLRRVLGVAGRILGKYGYSKVEDWRHTGEYRYPYGLQLSSGAMKALDDASDADVTVIELRKEILKLERAIGEARAQAAWEGA